MEMMKSWLLESTHVQEKHGWFLLLANREIAYILTETWRHVVRKQYDSDHVLIPDQWVRLLSPDERLRLYYSLVSPDLADPIPTQWHQDMRVQADLEFGEMNGFVATVHQDGRVYLNTIYKPKLESRMPIYLDQYRISAGLPSLYIREETRPLDYTLISYYSERDRNGNVYWAFQMAEHETGKVVRGLISGDDSNIYQITRFWNAHDDWDRTIQCITIGLSKKEFNRITAGWEYAGCRADDEIVPFIRRKLAGIG